MNPPQTPELPPSNEAQTTPSQPGQVVGTVVSPVSTLPTQVNNPEPSQPAPLPTQPTNVSPPPFDPITQGKKRRFSKKLILVILAILIIMGVSVSAAYFGYIVPNKPENIWSKALVNTGKGFDKLSDYAETVDASKGVKVDGSFKVTGSLAANGSITGQSDGENAEGKLDLSMAGIKITAETKSIKSIGTSPDLYLKVNGIQGLGSLLGAGNSQFTKTLNGINNQWYVIDHSLFDQIGYQANSSISRDDINKLLNDIAVTNKKYLFTDDPQKSALVVKENVGKETKEDRKTYHYKVGFNKQNLKSYTTELCNNLKNSKLIEAPKGGSTDAEVSADELFNCSGLNKSIDAMDDSATADVWVDLQTKLIQAVRFSENNSKDNYLDLIQNYTGGDEFPFSLKVHNKADKEVTEGVINITLNTKTNVVKINGDFKTTGSSKQTGNLTLTITPSEESLKITKPAGAKTIIELFNDLGLPNLFQTLGPTQSTSNTSLN